MSKLLFRRWWHRAGKIKYSDRSIRNLDRSIRKYMCIYILYIDIFSMGWRWWPRQNGRGHMGKFCEHTTWWMKYMAASVFTSHVFGPTKLIFDAGGTEQAKFNIRTDQFEIWTDPFANTCVWIYIYIYIYQVLSYYPYPPLYPTPPPPTPRAGRGGGVTWGWRGWGGV